MFRINTAELVGSPTGNALFNDNFPNMGDQNKFKAETKTTDRNIRRSNTKNLEKRRKRKIHVVNCAV